MSEVEPLPLTNNFNGLRDSRQYGLASGKRGGNSKIPCAKLGPSHTNHQPGLFIIPLLSRDYGAGRDRNDRCVGFPLERISHLVLRQQPALV
jgi:hypothetical protein